MRNREMQFAGLYPGRRIDDQFAIQTKRPFMVPQPHIRGGEGGEVGAVAWLELQQLLELGNGLRMLMST